MYLVPNRKALMMKSLLFVLIFCLGSATAQITISSADLPVAGDIVNVSIANPTSVSNPELTGTNYNWNFSMLTATQQRVDTFLTIGSTPLAYQFFFNNPILYPDHVADFALRGIDFPNVLPQLTVSEVINYYALDNGSYRQVGFGANINGIPASVRFQPTDTNYVLPLQYGQVNLNIYNYNLSVPSTLYYGQDGVRTDTVDGWGVVETPYGTFNAIRVKSTLNKTDTTYLDLASFGTSVNRPEEIEYKWLANGEKIPVLKIITTGGQVSTVEYKDNFLGLSVEDEETRLQMSLYPNPCVDQVSLNLDRYQKDLQYVIYDMSGRVVLTGNLTQKTSNLDVSSLSDGSYVIQVFDQQISQVIEFKKSE